MAMPEVLVAAAPWIALFAAVAASAVVAAMALRAWRDWRRTNVTRQAATALIDVHMADLDRTLQQLDEHVGSFADGGERLAESLSELKADAAHLRWMVGRIPDERERLARELYELVLPTGARPGGGAGEQAADATGSRRRGDDDA